LDSIPSPKKEWELSQGSFERLLEWLGDNRESGGRKYEEIRRKLIKIFVSRGCAWPEELADEVINRVVRKIFEITEKYDNNDPALYFYGVAQHVYREYFSRASRPTPHAPPPPPPPDLSAEECLEHCMRSLERQDQTLALEYFAEKKRAKIDLHKDMAERFGISVNALRIRAHRLRARLRRCVFDCLDQKKEGRNDLAVLSIH
jgi:DNA-directed RNA polymerase specialized sigma24 family protein